MSNRDLLRALNAMRPRGCFVIERAGFDAAVQDADESVGELAQRGVVVGAASSVLVVVGAPSGRGVQGGEGLGRQRIDEPVVARLPRSGQRTRPRQARSATMATEARTPPKTAWNGRLRFPPS